MDKKILITLFICMILIAPLVSALEVDNVLNKDIETYGKAGYKNIEIKNMWVIVKILWEGTLEKKTEE